MKKYISVIFLNAFLILSSCSLECPAKVNPDVESKSIQKTSANCSSHGRTAMTKKRTKKMLCN